MNAGNTAPSVAEHRVRRVPTSWVWFETRQVYLTEDYQFQRFHRQRERCLESVVLGHKNRQNTCFHVHTLPIGDDRFRFYEADIH